jgi:hypothetical protein
MNNIHFKKCSNCFITLTKNKYSISQLKKKEKRKCINCLYVKDQGEDVLLSNLIKWLIENDVKFKPLEIRQLGPEYRGVVANCRIKPGTNLISVPNECIISLNNIKNTNLGKFISKYNVCSHTYLAMKILKERNDLNSKWKPYIDILPLKFQNVPLFYTTDEIKSLKGSIALDMVKCRKISIKHEYDIMTEDNTLFEEYFSFSLEEYTWARTVVITRIFGFKIKDVVSSGLVPLADMLNHDLNPGTKWEFNDELDAFTVLSTKWLLKGSNILDSYGPKCNSRYLVNYGFTLQDNKYNNECSIFLPTTNVTKKQKLLIGDSKSIDNGFITYSNLIITNNETKVSKDHMFRFQIPIYNSNELNSPSRKCILSLFAIARAIVCEDDNLPDNIHILNKPLSIENELKTFKLIHTSICCSILEFNTSLDEDLDMIQNLTPYSSNHNIRTMLIGEKTTLYWYLNLCSAVMDDDIKYLKNNYPMYYNNHWKKL